MQQPGILSFSLKSDLVITLFQPLHKCHCLKVNPTTLSNKGLLNLTKYFSLLKLKFISNCLNFQALVVCQFYFLNVSHNCPVSSISTATS